jgi:DNA invertase Pin-like site-specific DNA recombinase
MWTGYASVSTTEQNLDLQSDALNVERETKGNQAPTNSSAGALDHRIHSRSLERV